jgi:hypothetical protein
MVAIFKHFVGSRTLKGQTGDESNRKGTGDVDLGVEGGKNQARTGVSYAYDDSNSRHGCACCRGGNRRRNRDLVAGIPLVSFD